ncbi:helix-turn-helix domain-containing protein [Streptomyces hirsutus]|uniref:helix-turn-helix domain-containing protein n=1 Tax=Streptomyces hirsutus TaxID=35620 RepID=UPI00363A5591
MKRRRPRVTGEERSKLARQMKAEYYAGSSIRNLAERHEFSYGTVRTLLLLAKTRLRRRGKDTRPRSDPARPGDLTP